MNPTIVKCYAEKLSRERGNKVRQYEAEAEMIDIIRMVSRVLAPRFKFGYHTIEDMEQIGFIFGWEVLCEAVYDVERPLQNFLYVHIHNQLHNYLRKNFHRSEAPCKCCYTNNSFNSPAKPCQKWIDWDARNKSKRNLMRPLDMSNIDDDGEPRMSFSSSVEDDVALGELENLIDTHLPVGLRADYRRMRDHVNIPKARRQRIREAIANIAREAGYFSEMTGQDNDEEEN